jgi:hypothetical protein
MGIASIEEKILAKTVRKLTGGDPSVPPGSVILNRIQDTNSLPCHPGLDPEFRGWGIAWIFYLEFFIFTWYFEFTKLLLILF